MGRTERELDPGAGPLERFACELRLLREGAGRPGYRELAARVHFSASRLSEAAAGRSLPSLPVTRAYVQGCGGDVEEWVRRWYQVRKELAAVAEGAAEGAAAEPPYLGLATFEEGDADRFFGRRQLIEDLAKRVADSPLLAVVGASGSGKSSLLRAGLLPRLTGEVALITPGEQPLRHLSAVLSRLPASSGDREDVVEPPTVTDRDPARAADRRVDDALPETGPGTLVVDQFEELFTLCRDAQVRERFIERLLALAGSGSGRVRVVLGVRADFYAQCAQHAGLLPVLRDAQVLVGPMAGTDLREAITGPAEQAGWCVEPELVEAIVADAAGQPGVLPLVSHALLETWQRRQGRTLTLTGYHAAGGLSEAIARTAERVYAGLDPKGREITHDLFLRLTALGEGTDDTRRRVRYAEFSDSEAVRSVLDRLAAARLVTCDTDEVSVAHEALIRRWPRLRNWLTTDRDQLLAHRRLTDATAEWEQHERDEAFLYRGRRLALWDGQPSRNARLNQAEAVFLEASRQHRDRETATQRRRARQGVAALVAVTVLVSVLAVVSTVQARRAGAERDQALSEQLAADAREQLSLQPEVSLLLARKAMSIRQTPAAQAALRQAVIDDRLRAVLTAPKSQVFGVAYSPDGHRVALSGDSGTVWTWNLAPDGAAHGPARALGGHQGEVWSPVFSPDGHLLAACGLDGTITVWDLATGGPPRILRGHTGKVWRVGFSPDGRWLASSGDDGTVRTWDPAAGVPVRTVAHTSARQLGLAYSPDGRHLAAGDSDGVIRIWDTTRASPPLVLRGHTNTVQNLAWTPDSSTLVSASTDGTARVWHPATPGGDPVVLRGDGAGTIETVAVSPDGTRVAAGGSDGTVRVFGLTGQDDPLILPGHDGTVWSLAYSPRGDRLLSGSGDGTARFWDPAYPGAPQVLHGSAASALNAVASSPDGRLLATGADDGTVQLWHPTTTSTPMVLYGHQGPVLSVAVDPTATRLASGGADGTVRIWDTATGHVRILNSHGGKVFGVAFLPSGRQLAAAEGSGTVRVWDLTTGTSIALTGHVGTVRSVAVSPDGRRLASTGRDGTVRVWDLSTRAATVLTGHHGGLVWQAAFSPDRRHLASSGDDGTVRIWDLTAPSTPPLVLHGHRGSVWTLAYSPDGQLLASSGADGGLRLWQASSGTLLASIRGYGSPIDQAIFGPATGWIATVHDDGTLRLSHCDACAPLTQIQAQADHLATRH